jgi:hypothetical protein
MEAETRLLPVVKADGREYLVDVARREYRDFDNPESVVKMHSPAGRELLEEIRGCDWKSFGLSCGKTDKGLEV